MAVMPRDYILYGTAQTVYFQCLLANQTAVYAGGFIAGESKVSKDGAAFANTTNLPVYIAGGVYSIALTVAETSADKIILTFINAGAEPVSYFLQTQIKTSRMLLDARTLPGTSLDGTGLLVYGTNAGTGSHAICGVGSGLGSGLCAVGGPTNAHGFFGVGGGTGDGFNGQTNPASTRPTNFFVEILQDLTGPPTPGASTLAQALAGVNARFYNLVTQTSTEQKIYKTDSSTVAATASVSDDGVTQTKGKAT